MPEIEETKFACGKCGYYVWASYDEDSSFVPESECPECNAGQLVETDETRVVDRTIETPVDEPEAP